MFNFVVFAAIFGISEGSLARPGYGVHITELAPLAGDAALWTHVVLFPNPKFSFEEILIPKWSNSWDHLGTECHDLMRQTTLPATNKQMTQWYESQIVTPIEDLKTEVINFYEESLSTIPSAPDLSRSKRGLFDGIGQGLKFLIGTSTVSDVEKLTKVIKEVTNMANVTAQEVVKLNADLASTINATLALSSVAQNLRNWTVTSFKVLEQEVNKFGEKFTEITHGLNLTVLLLNCEMRLNVLILATKSIIVSDLSKYLLRGYKELGELKRAIADMGKGYIPRSMFKPKDLRNIVSVIEGTISKQISKRAVTLWTDDEIYKYYEQPVGILLTINNGLSFMINVPFLFDETTLKVLRLSVYPVRLFPSTQDCSLFKLDKPILIITPRNERYTRLSESQYVSLKSTLRTEQLVSLFYPSTVPSCEWALYIGSDYEILKRLCTIKLRPNCSDTTIFPVSPSKWFVDSPNTAQWFRSCFRRNKENSDVGYSAPVIPCSPCVINMPCGCKLIVGNVETNIATQSCGKSVSSFVAYQLNPIGFHLAGLQLPVIFNGSTLSATPPQYKPLVVLDYHNLTEESRIKEVTLRLSDLSSNITNRGPLFQNKISKISADLYANIRDLERHLTDNSLFSKDTLLIAATVGLCAWCSGLTLVLAYLIVCGKGVRAITLETQLKSDARRTWEELIASEPFLNYIHLPAIQVEFDVNFPPNFTMPVVEVNLPNLPSWPMIVGLSCFSFVGLILSAVLAYGMKTCFSRYFMNNRHRNMDEPDSVVPLLELTAYPHLAKIHTDLEYAQLLLHPRLEPLSRQPNHCLVRRDIMLVPEQRHISSFLVICGNLSLDIDRPAISLILDEIPERFITPHIVATIPHLTLVHTPEAKSSDNLGFFYKGITSSPIMLVDVRSQGALKLNYLSPQVFWSNQWIGDSVSPLIQEIMSISDIRKVAIRKQLID